MIRVFARSLLLAAAVTLPLTALPLSVAFAAPKSPTATKDKKGGAAKDADKADPTADPKKGKSTQIATFGDWRGFLAQSGKEKTCYALASPKNREPAALKREPAYMFISNRPAENVRNEISIMLGFAVKDGGDSHAEIGSANFDLVTKGTNAWIKNTADEGRFIDALKKGGKLVIKAPSLKGNVTTDSYMLAGLKQVLEKVQKECP